MPRRRRRMSLVLGGMIMGLLGLAIGLWSYVQLAREDQVRTDVGVELRTARESAERLHVSVDTALAIGLRGVVLHDEFGDTVLAASGLTMSLDPRSLAGDGAIEFADVVVDDPVANLVRTPEGEWNFLVALANAAGGQPSGNGEDDRPFVFRDVRLGDGRLVLSMPGGGLEFAGGFTADLTVVEVEGVPYQIYRASGIEARLPLVRIGGSEGWRAEFATLSAALARPAVEIANLEGWFEQAGEDGVNLDVAALDLGESTLAASGGIRFDPAGVLYDLEVRAAPVRLIDFQPIFPTLPETGTASFAVGIESSSPERIALDFTGIDAEALGSRILGDIAFAVGGDVPPALLGGDLELAPLRLATLEELGLVTELPLLGDLAGRITTTGAAPGSAEVDLRSTLVPRDQPEADPSIVIASGSVAIGGPDEPLRLDGVAVGLQPLYLASLAGLLPTREDQLRGEVRGAVTLGGTLTDLQLTDGALTYEVGESMLPTRLTGLSGGLTMSPTLQYDLRATAQPLALATITELFPSLPFRSATLSGAITVAGTSDFLEVAADLSGPAGGLAFTATADLLDPLRFEVDGSLNAFSTGMLLRPDVPVEGPLTGSFTLAGTPEQFRFTADLAQAEGSFSLTGGISLGIDPPRFDVAGSVSNFPVGAVVGQPDLFPGPMTGPIAVEGGGGDPYEFDVDLRGESGQFTLAGFFVPGEVPVYEARGFVSGLDASGLPVQPRLPVSTIVASVDISGRGADLASLEGRFAFDATESSVSGLPLEAAVGRIRIVSGVMLVDTLDVVLDRTRVTANGSWGLRSPAPEPLRFTIDSPNLGVLGRILAPGELVPPRITGRLQATGQVSGSVEYPDIEGTFVGRDLRYEELSAATLEVDLDVAKDRATGWGGQLSLVGTNLALPQVENLQSVNLQAAGTEFSLGFDLFAVRDSRTRLEASGLADLDGLTPRAIALLDMRLRLDGAEWLLLNPTQVQYTEANGLRFENFVLQRTAPTTGLITIDGGIPPSGLADLTLSVTDFDLQDLRRISPQAPALEGMLSLDGELLGPVTDPQFSLNARVDRLRLEAAQPEALTFGGLYSAGVFTGSGEASVGETSLFRADVSIPMLLSLDRMVPDFELQRSAPAAMTVVADSLPLDLLAAFIPAVRDGRGTARAAIEVGGTLDALQLDGWVQVHNGALFIEPLQVAYSDIEADIALEQNRMIINSFSARSDGTLVASGMVDFPAGAPPALAISAGFDNFVVMNDESTADLMLSGQVRVDGPVTQPVLTGSIGLSESTIFVPELAQEQPGLQIEYEAVTPIGPPPTGDLALAPPFLGNLRVDGLELSVGEGVWLESSDMRVQITGDLVVYRVGADFRVFGALEAVRGTYALEISAIVRQFDVIRGRVQFFGTGDLNPSLDILAGYRVRSSTVGRGGDLTILVQLSGTLLSPRVQLTSDTPVPLSETDLVSYLLFGRPNFELGGLTQSFAEELFVQEVGGILAAELIERPILRAGICDWVRVRPGLTTNIRGLASSTLTGSVIECGREIADEWFLTAQTGFGILGGEFTEASVGVEWQIDSQWLWEASYGSVQRSAVARIFDTAIRTQFSTDIRRQWEYGRPSERSLIDITPENLAEPGSSVPISEPLPAPPANDGLP